MGGQGSGRPGSVDFGSAADRDPWEQQPRETSQAFVAFKSYRDLGLDRTVAKALVVLGKKPNYTSTCEQWSVRWGWRVRCVAWDAHEDRHEREAALQLAEKSITDKIAVADGLWKTAAKGIIMWNKHIDHVMGVDPAQTTVPPISPTEVYRLADSGLKLSQLLEGKPTDIQEQRDQITIDERRRGIQQLLGSTKLRSAMKQVATALKECDDDGDTGPIH